MIAYFCINRTGDTARRAAMEAQARQQGLALVFVKAVEGEALDLDDPGLGYDRRRRLRAYGDLSRTEIACVCSHRQVLERFLDGTAAHAVVLEDDARLADGFAGKIEQLVRGSRGWHLLRLECRCGRTGYTIGAAGKGLELYAPLDAEIGSTATLYSREGAGRTLGALRQYIRPIDEHLGLFWRWGLRVVEVAPPLVAEDRSFPTTACGRGGRRRRGFRAWFWTRPVKMVHGIAKRVQALRTVWSVRRAGRPAGQAPA